MDSLPQWESLSEAAQARLMLSVNAMLDGDTRSMLCTGDAAIWGELHAAGVVHAVSGTDTCSLTGPGACLVLDVMEATFAEGVLVAA